MFEAIKYRLQLRKLENDCNKIRKSYAKLKKGLSGSKLQEVLAEEGSVMLPDLLGIDRLKSRHICQIANRLMVSLPDMKDEELWEVQPYYGTRILTSKGIWELKKLIRQEKRERYEIARAWLSSLTGIIAAIAGVIAALTGLVVVLTL